MKICRWLALGLLLAIASLGHAENGCPPGMIPASGTDINSCVPIPKGYYGQQANAQPVLPPPVFQSRWGAIATDGPGGHLGVASNLLDQESAEQTALGNCRAKGGINCQIETWYRNGCAAMIVGEQGHNSSNGTDLNDAINAGMGTCNASDKNCRVFYSGCSYPVPVE